MHDDLKNLDGFWDTITSCSDKGVIIYDKLLNSNSFKCPQITNLETYIAHRCKPIIIEENRREHQWTILLEFFNFLFGIVSSGATIWLWWKTNGWVFGKEWWWVIWLSLAIILFFALIIIVYKIIQTYKGFRIKIGKRKSYQKKVYNEHGKNVLKWKPILVKPIEESLKNYLEMKIARSPPAPPAPPDQ